MPIHRIPDTRRGATPRDTADRAFAKIFGGQR